jgi:hypothetical protein
MSGCEAATTGNAFRFQSRECRRKGVHAAEMRAISAGARRQFDMAGEEKGGTFFLDDGGQRLSAIDQRAFVGVGEAQENRGNVAGSQTCRKRIH